MVLIFLIIKLFSAKMIIFKSMDMKLMRCKKLLPSVLPISSEHFSGTILYKLQGLLIWPQNRFERKGRFDTFVCNLYYATSSKYIFHPRENF